mmetsp:Transcript_13558/g.21157  ORF Transcript_13558/g.21157 Transcript_13558/m.21157 type:complete len:126 (+) Transcript_13558:3137-3514(+)
MLKSSDKKCKKKLSRKLTLQEASTGNIIEEDPEHHICSNQEEYGQSFNDDGFDGSSESQGDSSDMSLENGRNSRFTVKKLKDEDEECKLIMGREIDSVSTRSKRKKKKSTNKVGENSNSRERRTN